MVLLTHEQHVEIAVIGQFYVEETLYNSIIYGESAVFSGDGVDDLDQVSARMIRNGIIHPAPTYTILLGDRPRRCLVDDIFAIRDEFVIIYGAVANPSVFKPRIYAPEYAP